METPFPSATAALDTAAPLRIERTVHLNSSPAAVFAFITNHEGMPAWVPGARRVSVERTDSSEVGAVRTIHAPFGYRVREEVVAHDPPQLFAYSLRGNAIIRDHLAEFALASDGKGTQLRLREYYSAPALLHPLADIIIRPAVRGMLRNLVAHFGGRPGERP